MLLWFLVFSIQGVSNVVNLCMKGIQMKVIEQYFPVAVYSLYKVVLTFQSEAVTIQIKATEHYFALVLYFLSIMLYKVIGQMLVQI